MRKWRYRQYSASLQQSFKVVLFWAIDKKDTEVIAENLVQKSQGNRLPTTLTQHMVISICFLGW